MPQEMLLEEIEKTRELSWKETLAEICIALLFLAMGIRTLLERPPRV